MEASLHGEHSAIGLFPTLGSQLGIAMAETHFFGRWVPALSAEVYIRESLAVAQNVIATIAKRAARGWLPDEEVTYLSARDRVWGQGG